MSKFTTWPSRLAIGICGGVIGSVTAYTAFRNGQSMASGFDGIAFGAAFAAVVVGSWFLLPIAETYRGLRAAVVRGGWALSLAFVLVNAIGFTATHRADGVADRATSLTGYDLAASALPHLRRELGDMTTNPRWAATAGCTNATAEQSKEFCKDVSAKRGEIAKKEAQVALGRPGATDAQADTIGWVIQVNSLTVGRALPIFIAIVMELAASLFTFIAMAPAQAAPVLNVEEKGTEVIIAEKAEEPKTKAKTPRKKGATKKKPKQITYQPVLGTQMDGRKIAGQRRRIANDDAFAPPAA